MNSFIWGGAYDAVLYKSDFDESEHPRVPAGSERGGQFVPKNMTAPVPTNYGAGKTSDAQIDSFIAQFDPVPAGLGDGIRRDDYEAMAVWSKSQLMKVLSDDERRLLSDSVSAWVNSDTVIEDPLFTEAAEIWGGEANSKVPELIDPVALRRVMLAQYAITQHVLRAVAPDGYVKLWRGIQNRDGQYGLGEQDYYKSPLASWTTYAGYAAMFAEMLPSKTARVLRADVPIEDIFMFPGTATILQSELEYVVIGRDEEIPVKMVRPQTINDEPYGLRD